MLWGVEKRRQPRFRLAEDATSVAACNLIESLMQADSAKRPTADGALKSPWRLSRNSRQTPPENHHVRRMGGRTSWESTGVMIYVKAPNDVSSSKEASLS